MTKTIFRKYILGGLFSFAFIGIAFAQTESITFPIPELGGCKDTKACKTYCDDKNNMLSCVNYAEKNNMISKEEAAIAKRVLPQLQSKETPGQCDSRKSCEAYCQNSPEHIDECIAFVEKAGALSGEYLAQAKKVAKALKSGEKLPGGCTGKGACETYCSDTSHIDECLNFAEKSDIIPRSEIAEARKVSKFLKEGSTPGKCKSKSECMAYCGDDSHLDECINFAEKAGLVPQEEIDMARKVGGKGPGGCKSQSECTAYCDDESHAKECADFALEKGLVTDEQKDLIKNAAQKINEGLAQSPEEARPKIESCLNEVFNGKLQEVLAGSVGITKTQGDKISGCFQRVIQEVMMNKAGGAAGAGGYTSPLGKSGGKAPSMDEIKKQIPSNVPPEMRAKIEEQIKEKINQGGSAVPAGAPANVEQQQGGAQVAPAGYGGGAPCNSEEDCRKMFGGGR
ncbi:MAG: hypothetical protein NTW35_02645 [Candidatus Nomurabacteria bacterium]|nr:hypothetical protein [Candidatus Nomurabacteria bacterium]